MRGSTAPVAMASTLLTIICTEATAMITDTTTMASGSRRVRPRGYL